MKSLIITKKYSKDGKLLTGFTLIELIIVMAVFLFIIGVAIGIFISIVKNQKKVLAQQQLLNQISYVEEYMSKALRMAKTAEDSSCLNSFGDIYNLTNFDSETGFYKGIKFINHSNNDACQEFFWDKEEGVLKESINNSQGTALTFSNIEIESVKFVINGDNTTTASNSDGIQPKVTILMKIKIAKDTQEPSKTIQTTISRRNLNLLKEN